MDATTIKTNVVELPRGRRQRPTRYATRKVSQREQAASRQQAFGAAVLALVAIGLTTLSLTHLSSGIAIVTGCPTWEAWLMAAAIDCGFGAFEGARILARERTLKIVGKHLTAAIVATLAGSAALNALAFSTAATGWMVYPAVAFGLSIPALIYVCTFAGSKMWIDR